MVGFIIWSSCFSSSLPVIGNIFCNFRLPGSTGEFGPLASAGEQGFEIFPVCFCPRYLLRPGLFTVHRFRFISAVLIRVDCDAGCLQYVKGGIFLSAPLFLRGLWLIPFFQVFVQYLLCLVIRRFTALGL